MKALRFRGARDLRIDEIDTPRAPRFWAMSSPRSSEVRRLGTVVQVGLFVKTARVDMFKVSEKALKIAGNWGFPITIGARVVNLIASGKPSCHASSD